MYTSKLLSYALFIAKSQKRWKVSEKGVSDDKLPEYPMEAVELADILIRTLDYCATKSYPLAEILSKKLSFNSKREDHKIENRIKKGGKLF